MHFGELLEVRHQRERDVIQRAVRLTCACEIDMRNAVGIFDAAIAVETVHNKRQPLIALHVAGTFEEFIEHRPDQILSGRDKARDRHFIRKLPADQAVVIGKVNIHLHEQRRARCCGGSCNCRRGRARWCLCHGRRCGRSVSGRGRQRRCTRRRRCECG